MKIVNDTETHLNTGQSKAKQLLEHILSRPLFAHLSTYHKDCPRDSPVWFLWEDEKIWIIGGYETDSFPKRIEHDPHCAIGIVDYNIKTGLVQHAGLRGKAHLKPQNTERVKRLLGKYMGTKDRWDPRFTAILGDKKWILICFEPETVVVRDQSYMINEK